MSSEISNGSSYIFVSNVRCDTLVHAVTEIARELAKNDSELNSVSHFAAWWKTKSFPGVGIELHERFRTTEEMKLWAQAFECLAWRVFERKWGNHENLTWQVELISSCHLISRMLTELVWKNEHGWWPTPSDADGIRPNAMRIQL